MQTTGSHTRSCIILEMWHFLGSDVELRAGRTRGPLLFRALNPSSSQVSGSVRHAGYAEAAEQLSVTDGSV